MTAPLLIVYEEEDTQLFHQLRTCLGSASATKLVKASAVGPSMAAIYAKKLGPNAGVLVSSEAFMRAMLSDQGAKRSSYEGSMLVHNGVEFVIAPDLNTLNHQRHGKFLMEHYVSKITRRESWVNMPAFTWVIGTDENMPSIVGRFASADIIAVDIETIKDPLAITMVGFTAIWINKRDGSMSMDTVVIPYKQFPNCTLWTQRLLELPAAKCFQGGRYDLAYLARYGFSPVNYMWDTMQMFHAWYAELPKDLGSIGAFCMRESRYWKDLATSANYQDKLLYNALDCYGTACSLIYMLVKMPDWARKNYAIKFPVIFPAHMCEMRGIKVDMERQQSVKAEYTAKLAADEAMLCRYVGKKGFKATSPKQVKQLMEVLGHKLASTSEKYLEQVAYKDPLSAVLTEQILEIRGTKKLIGTYMNEEKLFRGRWMYSLLPYGTDTGRNASGEMAFWCGQNLQNIPVRDGPIIRQFLVADEGFRLGEVDSEQAESRDTAYISGDTKLIAAVSGTKDFHSLNCAAFFQVPYETIYDDDTKKTKNKKLRDVAKRVNHGANYCMGSTVLVQTMGMANIDVARAALGLSRGLSYTSVADRLLAAFHATYPRIAGLYYKTAARTIMNAKRITGATGWTRYCFGNLSIKHDFNSYMAHSPQSLNAMRLDQAFIRVFIDLAIHPEHSKNFKLFMQIHDSIFFQVRIGHEYLFEEVRKRMEIPITIKGCDGITRTYTVPAAVKSGKNKTGAIRWSETE